MNPSSVNRQAVCVDRKLPVIKSAEIGQEFPARLMVQMFPNLEFLRMGFMRALRTVKSCRLKPPTREPKVGIGAMLNGYRKRLTLDGPMNQERSAF